MKARVLRGSLLIIGIFLWSRPGFACDRFVRPRDLSIGGLRFTPIRFNSVVRLSRQEGVDGEWFDLKLNFQSIAFELDTIPPGAPSVFEGRIASGFLRGRFLVRDDDCSRPVEAQIPPGGLALRVFRTSLKARALGAAPLPNANDMHVWNEKPLALSNGSSSGKILVSTSQATLAAAKLIGRPPCSTTLVDLVTAGRMTWAIDVGSKSLTPWRGRLAGELKSQAACLATASLALRGNATSSEVVINVREGAATLDFGPLGLSKPSVLLADGDPRGVVQVRDLPDLIATAPGNPTEDGLDLSAFRFVEGGPRFEAAGLINLLNRRSFDAVVVTPAGEALPLSLLASFYRILAEASADPRYHLVLYLDASSTIAAVRDARKDRLYDDDRTEPASLLPSVSVIVPPTLAARFNAVALTSLLDATSPVGRSSLEAALVTTALHPKFGAPQSWRVAAVGSCADGSVDHVLVPLLSRSGSSDATARREPVSFAAPCQQSALTGYRDVRTLEYLP